MGREFVNIFDEWADSYDASVTGQDPEYRDVFENYVGILKTVAENVYGTVLEFGTGTGNLTAELLQRNLRVIGIEPNDAMRVLTAERFPDLSLWNGDLLQFSMPNETIHCIVSTYVFHHLTDVEKQLALQKYFELLPVGGKVVFADTAFESQQLLKERISFERSRGFHHVADDLEREYYTTLPILKQAFEQVGFTVSFTQMNAYVWLMDATK